MENIFKQKICSICKNNLNCNYISIQSEQTNVIKIYNCPNYLKDEEKITPYVDIEFVAVKGKYKTTFET